MFHDFARRLFLVSLVVLTTFAQGRVFGERYGDAPADVLALHGWGGDHRQLAGVISGGNAISLDLPGFGASAPPSEVWGAEMYADAIAPILDEMYSRVTLVGFSFGGRIAVHLAAKHPERVGGVVLTGAPLLRPATSSKAPLGFRLFKKLHRLGLVSEERMEGERQKRGSSDYRHASGVMRDILVRLVNESYEAQMAALQCPVEMVWGDQDTAAPLELAKKAADLCPTAQLTVVAGASHFLPLEQPEAVRAAISRVQATYGTT